MSIENHPNFHVINFVTQIMSAYYDSLRGGVNNHNAPDVKEEVASFANKIEEKIDEAVLGMEHKNDK